MPSTLQLEPLQTFQPAPASSNPFDPEEWIYDPISRLAMPIDSVRACSCGSTSFVMVTRGEGSQDHHVYCDRCYGNPRYRMARPQDVIYGRFDSETLEMSQLLPTSEILARRAAIGGAR